MSRNGFHPSALVALAVLLLAVSAIPRAFAVTFTVNSNLDQPDNLLFIGTCHTAANTCTLRAAVMQANRSSAAVATIMLPADTYTLTIPADLSDGETTGDLNLTSPVGPATATIVIQGVGADITIIDGNGLDRVFRVHENRVAMMSGITIRNGSTLIGESGGGIRNDGSLTVSNSIISGNHAYSKGGGIYDTQVLTVLNSVITGNTAGAGSSGEGGGIYSSGDLNVRDSTIGPSNTAGSNGGGIYNQTGLTMRNSTVRGNHARYGGGIFNFGNMTVMNGTISGNQAERNGGGIENIAGNANVYNTTIAFNVADADGDNIGIVGGVHNVDVNGAVFNLRNTMIVGNTASKPPFSFFDDCGGTLTGYGANLFKAILVASGCTVQGSWSAINSVSLLGPLQDNGGPTSTHALLLGNNAIDSGIVCVDYASMPLTTDQRGAPRIFRSSCDIGAVEYVDRGIDIDANHAYDPLTDGLMILRYLLGFAGTALTANAIGPGSSIDPAFIPAYLDYIRPLLDVDGNSQIDALTDGVLLLHYLSGTRGPGLIANALGMAATRNATQVEQYIRILLP